jgi:hypothetical protein
VFRGADVARLLARRDGPAGVAGACPLLDLDGSDVAAAARDDIDFAGAGPAPALENAVALESKQDRGNSLGPVAPPFSSAAGLRRAGAATAAQAGGRA